MIAKPTHRPRLVRSIINFLDQAEEDDLYSGPELTHILGYAPKALREVASVPDLQKYRLTFASGNKVLWGKPTAVSQASKEITEQIDD